jgi:sterol desaturase/sphingolipid hydroxylase (fatty acid hydroxylase superfamily)
MGNATDILGIAQERALHIFTFDFGRYLIAAGLVSAIVWILRRTRFATRKIQPREAGIDDFRREFLASIRTVMVYVGVSIVMLWGFRNGIYRSYAGEAGPGVIAAYLAAILLAHDAYFYWAHRAMHHPRLFRHFHRFHHRTVTPTAWAAYSFAIPEAVVMALFMPLWLWFVPTPAPAIFIFLAVMILRNTMGHAGLELHPRGWASHPVLKWISTTTHHDLHHAGSFAHNFGFYFTFWDKLMGTEHPAYVETFDRVTRRRTPLAPASAEPVPSPVL